MDCYQRTFTGERDGCVCTRMSQAGRGHEEDLRGLLDGRGTQCDHPRVPRPMAGRAGHKHHQKYTPGTSETRIGRLFKVKKVTQG